MTCTLRGGALLLLCATSASAQSTGPAGSDGRVPTFAKWAPIELSFRGPATNEGATNPNPFEFYRLQVAFTSPSGTVYDVPGFYDGDGKGKSPGDVWKARFSADEVGEWKWTASFREGAGIAIDLDPTAGTSAYFDGATGAFEVRPIPDDAEGLLRLGRLEAVGTHNFRFREGEWFLKGGADSPENLLAYTSFDNTQDLGGIGILHSYQPHLGDWQPGDPEINPAAPDRGRALIGALNYLSSVRVNSVYFLPMNLGGDGQDTCPFVSYAKTGFAKSHYDVSKLTQWKIALEHAQRKGIVLQFVLAETETGNEKWLDEGGFGSERKLFFRELIARFGHLLAIKWNLSEESDFPFSTVDAMAQYIRDVDPYDHPISIHTRSNEYAVYNFLLGNPLFDVQSFQIDENQADFVTEDWRAKSAAAGRPWVIDIDEVGPPETGLSISNAVDRRKRILYDVYFSGGEIEWYLGPYFVWGGGGDQTLEDFRTREEMWNYTWYARSFLQDNVPFWEMEPADSRLTGEHGAFGGGEVFAKPDEVFAVYLPNASNGGTLDVGADVVPFRIRWYNPRTGQFEGPTDYRFGGAPMALGSAPSDPTNDWVVLVERTALWSPTETLSISTNGVQDLRLDAGTAWAGANYLVLGTRTGTEPGFQITKKLLVPVNPDGWMLFTLTYPTTPPFSGFVGVLDQNGEASASLTLVAPESPTLVGIELNHAFVAGYASPKFASNPFPLRFTP